MGSGLVAPPESEPNGFAVLAHARCRNATEGNQVVELKLAAVAISSNSASPNFPRRTAPTTPAFAALVASHIVSECRPITHVNLAEQSTALGSRTSSLVGKKHLARAYPVRKGAPSKTIVRAAGSNVLYSSHQTWTLDGLPLRLFIYRCPTERRRGLSMRFECLNPHCRQVQDPLRHVWDTLTTRSACNRIVHQSGSGYSCEYGHQIKFFKCVECGESQNIRVS